MLELAVLGLLKEQPLHGYDLRKRLRENLGILTNLSFGSLYPALARLESSGAVHAVAAPPPTGAPLPPTGSLAGERAALVARRAAAKASAALEGRGRRARKVYEITPVGEALFEQLLAEPVNDDDARAFEARLVFARHLSKSARLRLLERRRIALSDRLEHARGSGVGPHDYYERAVAEHALETIAADLDFVEKLLVAEHADAPERNPDRPAREHARGESRAHRSTTTTGRISS